MKSGMCFLALWTVAFIACATLADAQQPAGSANPAPETVVPETTQPLSVSGDLSISPQRIFDMFLKGSWVHVGTMWSLVAASILTLAIALERLVVLRSSRIIPKTFVNRFMDRLRDGDLDRVRARELCRDNGSPIANVFAIVMNHAGQPAAEVRQAVGEGAQSEIFYLRRRLRGLNGMATLAPLLGLFGTVIGMIEAFYALSKTAAGKTEKLADGISLALGATAFGLLIAIVAAASYYFLMGRVDRIVQRMDSLAEEVIDHVSAGSRTGDKHAARPRVVPAREQASV
jgi:biopolymer transport protein ExbB